MPVLLRSQRSIKCLKNKKQLKGFVVTRGKERKRAPSMEIRNMHKDVMDIKETSTKDSGTTRIKIQRQFNKKYTDLMNFIPEKAGGQLNAAKHINNDLNPLYDIICDPSPPSTA
jgi:hypothetical protein